MPSDEEQDTTIYTVVANYEEQYSIWPKHKAIPEGWKAVGKEGLKPECLQYVPALWYRCPSLRVVCSVTKYGINNNFTHNSKIAKYD
jgi:MbtH protein